LPLTASDDASSTAEPTQNHPQETPMSNPQGTPIWYELMTRDPVSAQRFYEAVVGWKFGEPPPPGSAMDYRMIAAPDGQVGGVFTLTADMCEQGARPAWVMYVGVTDVDTSVAAISAAGGQVHVPAFDIPGVGRIAMVADPQGAPFYVMRGASDGTSTACAPDRAGHGAWHELHAKDGPAATAFYADQFGWTRGQAMDMGADGVYQLMSLGGQDLAGIMTASHSLRPTWLIYFRVDGIDHAAERIAAAGGQVVLGPMEVPGGGWIVNGIDPDGAMFGLTGTR
jgi:predicted enzyme related to lactoylglutathione lyase